MARSDGFTRAAGRWAGCAEVFGGDGRFLGNGVDRRNVQPIVGENRVRIDLSFIGPFKFSGHYFIEDRKTERLYQGPLNVGYAEPLSESLVDSNSYWAAVGLSQRFFLMVLPDGQRQLSLAQLTRGDQLVYTVVGENQRVADGSEEIPGLVNGASCDLANDPAAGRGEILLHRRGRWTGQLTLLDETLTQQGSVDCVETVRPDGDEIHITATGTSFDPQPLALTLKSNGFQAWSGPGDVVGSLNLSGGRASSGHFHHLGTHLRAWRREVVAHNGDLKAVVTLWYRGSQRVGAQFGVLAFEPE